MSRIASPPTPSAIFSSPRSESVDPTHPRAFEFAKALANRAKQSDADCFEERAERLLRNSRARERTKGESHASCQRSYRQRHSSYRAGRTGRRGKDQPCRSDAVRQPARPTARARRRTAPASAMPARKRARAAARPNSTSTISTISATQFAIIDAPGSIGFAADGARGDRRRRHRRSSSSIPTRRAPPLAAPALRMLDELGIPHLIFVNRIDQAHGRIRDLLDRAAADERLAADRPPDPDPRRREGHRLRRSRARTRLSITGPGKASERIDIPADLAEREAEARTQMLEQLADHDDDLLEQLLMDETPERRTRSSPISPAKPATISACRSCSARPAAAGASAAC